LNEAINNRSVAPGDSPQNVVDVGGRNEVGRLPRVQVELLETVEKIGPVAATLAAGDVELLALVVNNGAGTVAGRGYVLSYSGSCPYRE
jgi:hypothetical protein